MNLENLGPVVLVGAGKMGTALARGWLAAGLQPANVVFVDPQPSDPIRAFAEEQGIALSESVPEKPARALIMAVKPQIFAQVMESVKPRIGAETLVLSIAAGISLESISNGLGTERVVRTMPNTPSQVGKGMTGAVAASGVNEEDRDIADALLSAAGKFMWFDDESELDALTSVSGSGPAYVFLLVECLAAAGEAEGLSPEKAMVLARQTVIGAAALMDADPTDAATLRKNVTSPNGVTAEALAVFMADDGLEPLVKRAVNAARRKSEEIGK